MSHEFAWIGVSVLLDSLSYQGPEPTEIETPVPVKFSLFKHDLNSHLYHAVHLSHHFI